MHVQDPPRRRRNEIEKARESADVADQRLGLHLFPQVGVRVAAEVGRPGLRVRLAIDAGKRPVDEDPIEVEVGAELTDGERMQAMDLDPSGQQIGLAPAQLPGARARDQEPETARSAVHRDLHRVEQRGVPVHLVQKNGPGGFRGCLEVPFQPLGMPHVLAEDPRAREVEGQVRLERGEQGGLAHLPRPEHEHAARVAPENPGEAPRVHVGIPAASLPMTTGNGSRPVAWRPGNVLSAVAGPRTRAAGG